MLFAKYPLNTEVCIRVYTYCSILFCHFVLFTVSLRSIFNIILSYIICVSSVVCLGFPSKFLTIFLSFLFLTHVSCKSHLSFFKTANEWRSILHCIKLIETYKTWWLHKALYTQEQVSVALIFAIIYPSITETWVNASYASIRPQVSFNACEKVEIMEFIITCFSQSCFYILVRPNSPANVSPLQYLGTLLLFR